MKKLRLFIPCGLLGCKHKKLCPWSTWPEITDRDLVSETPNLPQDEVGSYCGAHIYIYAYTYIYMYFHIHTYSSLHVKINTSMTTNVRIDTNKQVQT